MGSHASVPKTMYCGKTDKIRLYKAMISPDASESLAFVGNTSTASVHTVVSELQSRYLAQLFLGNLTLPSRLEMEKEIDKHEHWVYTSRYEKDDPSYVDMVAYMDWLAKQIGCDVQSRLTWGLWFRKRKLYNYITKGPFSGHQFRYSLVMHLC